MSIAVCQFLPTGFIWVYGDVGKSSAPDSRYQFQLHPKKWSQIVPLICCQSIPPVSLAFQGRKFYDAFSYGRNHG